MRGYKALNNDMTSTYGKMTYELGKEYILEEKMELCESGFHFAQQMHEPFIFYGKGSRLFEVEASGEILEKDYTLCTNKIKLVREITKEELDKYFQDNLDKLINDESSSVRCAVAEQGYGLDKLINDKSFSVRYAVASQGYGLDKLINDEDWLIRCAVAEQGYGLDKLINDKSFSVRSFAKRMMKKGEIVHEMECLY